MPQVSSASQLPTTTQDSQVSSNHEYLTSLPPELLIKVLSEIPLSSFLNLTHTSRDLRTFIKTNAARISNAAIESRFSFKAKILEKCMQDNGWLSPGLSKLEEKERIYESLL
jgi:hypothetical protein